MTKELTKSPKIKARYYNFDGKQYLEDFESCDWYFCAHELCKVFDIPLGVTSIQFFAYAHPGKDRVELNIADGITIDGEYHFIVSYTEEKIVKKLRRFKKPVYVECVCEYVE